MSFPDVWPLLETLAPGAPDHAGEHNDERQALQFLDRRRQEQAASITNLNGRVDSANSSITTVQNDLASHTSAAAPHSGHLTKAQADGFYAPKGGASVQPVTHAGGNLSVDATLGAHAKVTINGDTTLAAPTNANDGQVVSYKLTNPAAATANRTVNITTNYQPVAGKVLQNLTIQPGGSAMVTTFSDEWATPAERYVIDAYALKAGTAPPAPATSLAGFRSASVAGGSGGARTVTAPTGVLTDDQLFFVTILEGPTPLPTPAYVIPTGATQVAIYDSFGSRPRIAVWQKRYAGEASWTFGHSGTGVQTCFVLACQGFGAAAPRASEGTYGGSNNTVTFSTVTAVSAGAVVFALCGASSNTPTDFSTPSGMDGRAVQRTGDFRAGAAFHRTRPSAGDASPGLSTVTTSDGLGVIWSSLVIVAEP